MNMKNILAVAFVAVLAGCASVNEWSGSGAGAVDTRPVGPNGERLNRIPGVESIEIPEGVSDKDALDVVERTVAATRPGERRNAFVSQWRLEARDKGNKWIRIGLSARSHYLCVCYRIENGMFVPDVPTSTNLKQNGTSIHRKVPNWINGLKPIIMQRFYDLVNGTNTLQPSVLE